MVVYVIKENIPCDPEFSGEIICLCSSEEKKNQVIELLEQRNKSEYISYYWEEYTMDQLILSI